MTDDPRTPDRPDAIPSYEIRVQGHVAPRLTERLAPLRPCREPDGTTTLTGPVADQAALHGLLRRMRDLGLALVSVARLGTPDAAPPHDATEDDPGGPPPS